MFGSAIGLSAFLLFTVQPLVGRLLLPAYGGAPAVWATVLAFFQVVLLGGYAYAHVVATCLSPNRGAALHLAVLSGALVFVMARRFLGVWPAVVVWMLWATGPNALEYRASYFAQSTTVCCWMVALACLDDWLRTQATKTAVMGAFALGVGACARPLTMLSVASVTMNG